MQESLDTAHSLAKFLNVSVAYVRKLSRKPDFPKIRIGHSVRFSREEVLAHLRNAMEVSK